VRERMREGVREIETVFKKRKRFLVRIRDREIDRERERKVEKEEGES
jgi:hypothetical protein